MNKALLTISALALGTGILFGLAPHVSAYRGNPNVQGPNYSPARHEAMEKAFENKDYNAWKNLMQGRGRAIQVVNAQNFNRFVEMRKLRLEGKIDEANKIRTELGLGLRNGAGSSQRMSMGPNWNK